MIRTVSKSILVLVFVLSSTFINHAYAQMGMIQNLSGFDERPVHFGFYLGLNTMDFRFSHYVSPLVNPELAKPDRDEIRGRVEQLVGDEIVLADVNPISPGFTVGMVANFRVSEALDFRVTPGMSFGNRNMVFNVRYDEDVLSDIGRVGIDSASYASIPSTYIDFPLSLRYKGKRYGNLRPFIFAGTTIRYDLENKRLAERVVSLKRTGLYVDFGLGLDSYFQFFRLTTELRVSLGLNNIINQDFNNSSQNVPYYSYALKRLDSNVFSLLFYFE